MQLKLFFPKKIYRCPCLIQPFQEALIKKQNLDEILNFILSFKFTIPVFSSTIYCCRVGLNKEDCFIICNKHLFIIFLSSENKCRCFNCIKNLMREYYTTFYYVEQKH